ncbi:P-loop containing nucleoside triphosphate hydrolase protein [Amylocystis lapponica]|nr:P-loop containing nucleoside triphosphate hydrolase protein [Amylocystis lapponica]
MSTTTLRHACRTPLTRRTLSTKVPTKIFAASNSAEFLGAAGSPESIPSLSGRPEVIVTGRANAGKSTLLNAVLGRTKLLNTSKQPGRTRTLNFYRVGADPGNLVLVDAPGYGARGRPEWGALFDHYVQTRHELRRVYVLINASHGVNEADRAMLQRLDTQCQASGGSHFTLQAVITKADALVARDARAAIQDIQRDIFEAAPTCLPAIVTMALKFPYFGIEEVRESIADACGLVTNG